MASYFSPLASDKRKKRKKSYRWGQTRLFNRPRSDLRRLSFEKEHFLSPIAARSLACAAVKMRLRAAKKREKGSDGKTQSRTGAVRRSTHSRRRRLTYTHRQMFASTFSCCNNHARYEEQEGRAPSPNPPGLTNKVFLLSFATLRLGEEERRKKVTDRKSVV